MKVKVHENRFLQGILGEGESDIILNTVNGEIRIEILKEILPEEI
jgi:hypothetical protein